MAGDEPLSKGLEALCRLQKTESIEHAIRGACADLLRESRADAVPVPLRPLLRRLGVRISSRRSASRAAAGGIASLHATRDGLEVRLHEAEARRNWRRMRFSVAHELVHALLYHRLRHPDLISSLDESPASHRQLERVCNIGAAELLMPSRTLRNGLRRNGLVPAGLLAMYDLFLVSREALLWQIGSITPGGAVLRWRRHARHEGETVAWRVVATYPAYGYDLRRPWLPQGATERHLSTRIPTTTADAVDRYWQGPVTVELGKRTWRCAATCSWFPTAKRNSEQPEFDGFPVPDERPSHWRGDLIMFLSEA